VAGGLGPRALTPPWLWLCLAAITLLAALVRYWQLETLPFGYWYDEAHKSFVAYQIAHGEQFPLYVTDNQGIEAGYFWLLAAWFRLFGASFFGSRALSALIGVATVPLTFFAVRELYGRQRYAGALSLAAAAWLAVLLWHVHWSRLGLETISVPFFAAALVALLAYACRRSSPWLFAAAGAVLGLSQYTNPGARVLPLLALALWLLLAPGPWRRRLLLGAVLFGAALLVYAPLGLYFIRHPEWFLNRLGFTSAGARAGGLPFLLGSALRTAASLNFRGDVLPRHNLSLRPAFDPVSSVLMVLGLAAMLRRGNAGVHRAHLALLAAIAITLLPGMLSDGAPAFGRTVTATPLLVALPALGAVALCRWLGGRRAGIAVSAAAFLAAAGLNLTDYFNRYPRQPGLFDAFEAGQWQLLSAASAAPAGYLVAAESNLAHPALRLAQRLSPDHLRLINGQSCWAAPLETAAPTTLAVLDDWLPQAQVAFPQVPARAVLHEPEVYPYGWLLSLPAGTRGAQAGLPALARFGDSIELLSVSVGPGPYAAGSVVDLTLAWHALAPVPQSFTRFAHLASAGSPWLAGADAEPCQGWYPTTAWRPGDLVEERFTLALPADLPAGRYTLVAGLYAAATGERLPVAEGAVFDADRVRIGALIVE
jgi:4-amino-4-deoxy-L-arabinose transferase-like glycosyltransferase